MALTWAIGNRLTTASAILTAPPISFAGWFYVTALANYPALFGISNSGGAEAFSVYMDPANNLNAETSVAGGANRAVTSGGLATSNTWHHCTAVFASSTLRSIYLDGTTKVTNTASRVPSSLAVTALGGIDTVEDFVGNLAFLGVWNDILTDADAVSLYTGFSPKKVRPDALISYPFLNGVSPGGDYCRAPWTLTGSLPVALNPRIYSP